QRARDRQLPARGLSHAAAVAVCRVGLKRVNARLRRAMGVREQSEDLSGRSVACAVPTRSTLSIARIAWARRSAVPVARAEIVIPPLPTLRALLRIAS